MRAIGVKLEDLEANILHVIVVTHRISIHLYRIKFKNAILFWSCFSPISWHELSCFFELIDGDENHTRGVHVAFHLEGGFKGTIIALFLNTVDDNLRFRQRFPSL